MYEITNFVMLQNKRKYLLGYILNLNNTNYHFIFYAFIAELKGEKSY